MISGQLRPTVSARWTRTLAATGLLAGVVATMLGSFAFGQGSIGAPTTARLTHGQPGDLHASEPLTTPTGTATMAVTATATITEPTATATLTPTDPPTATASPTATHTPTATLTPTPAPTRPPQPAYLPVLLRDPVCVPQASYADIVFVVDTSNYMRNPFEDLISSEWARYWMRTTVDNVDLAHSRLGLVQFNRDVTIIQHLTNDRQAILNAIADKPDRENGSTRMDMGLRAGRDMLLGEFATPGNKKVIFFISIMQARDIPWRGIPGCVDERGDECAALWAAREVKNGPGPITIYALATSWYGGGEDLKGIASDPSKAILLPSPEDIARICDEVEVVKPCPNDLYWPKARP